MGEVGTGIKRWTVSGRPLVSTHRDRETEDRETEDRKRDRQRERQRERHGDREIERHRDRLTERQRETQRQREFVLAYPFKCDSLDTRIVRCNWDTTGFGAVHLEGIVLAWLCCTTDCCLLIIIPQLKYDPL